MGLNQDMVKYLFDYKDGAIYWRVSRCNKVKVGSMAGMARGDGRRIVSINAKLYLASRVIFLWHNGYLPVVVDHKDRNKLNDRIENLRGATSAENCKNTSSRKNSSSRFLGVSWSKLRSKWVVHIKANGVVKHIGYYISENDAALSYNKVASANFGEFANLNII